MSVSKPAYGSVSWIVIPRFSVTALKPILSTKRSFIATQASLYIYIIVSSFDGRPAYCSKLEEEGALVTRLEDRYSYQYQQFSIEAEATINYKTEQELSVLWPIINIFSVV